MDNRLDSLDNDIKTIIRVLEEDKLDTALQDHAELMARCSEKRDHRVSRRRRTSNAPSTEDIKPRLPLDPLLTQVKNNYETNSRDEPVSSKHIAILKLLRFRQMEDRLEEVAPAHRKTFEWIFRDDGETTPWSNFVQWLRADRPPGPYWVRGKAGSGKSTLMKYIGSHPQTRTALLEWAGNVELVTASFFFWNLGTTMQKSLLGLLRSLLHTVLDMHPEFSSLVFPELWQMLGEKRADLSPLSLSEIKRAFARLTTAERTPYKICFFVDGIDEFEGDHTEIASFFTNLCSPNVKTIVSSRPIAACIDAFGECPLLRLEDLTYPDIKIYVNDNLRKHKNMIDLVLDEPTKAPVLVEDLIEKAAGVFLWVKLVVKSLVDGLQNGDHISDLQRRLAMLPPDLEDLYRHMLGKVVPLYREQASQIFQIVRQGMAIRDQPLKTLVLSSAEQDPISCLRAGIQDLSAEKALQKCKAMENRLRSRCCGLLEVRDKSSIGMKRVLPGLSLTSSHSSSERDLATINSEVQYLHRTVAEYLHRQDIWTELLQLTVGTGFNVHQCLAHACLFKLKNMPSEEISREDMWSWTRNFVACYRATETTTGFAQVEVVDELDRVMKHHWAVGKGWGQNHWFDRLPDACAKTTETPKMSPFRSIFSFAVRVGLSRYVERKLELQGPDLLVTHGRPLLKQALGPQLPESGNLPQTRDQKWWKYFCALVQIRTKFTKTQVLGILLSVSRGKVKMSFSVHGLPF